MHLMSGKGLQNLVFRIVAYLFILLRKMRTSLLPSDYLPNNYITPGTRYMVNCHYTGSEFSLNSLVDSFKGEHYIQAFSQLSRMPVRVFLRCSTLKSVLQQKVCEINQSNCACNLTWSILHISAHLRWWSPGLAVTRCERVRFFLKQGHKVLISPCEWQKRPDGWRFA